MVQRTCLQKRLQVIKSAIMTGSIQEAARENRVTYETAFNIVQTFRASCKCWRTFSKRSNEGFHPVIYRATGCDGSSNLFNRDPGETGI